MSFLVEKTWIEANGINKWAIFLNRYDEKAKKWVRMPTIKKREDSRYVYYDAVINDFSLFAITGSHTVPREGFKASDLFISPSPAVVTAGEPITIAADIKNELGEADKYVATLWIDSTIEDMKYITLAKGAITTVVFDVIKSEVGIYKVRVGRQTGSFEVLPAAAVKPAAFKVSQLDITPAEIKVGEKVAISAVVANVGETKGSYDVKLKINGKTVDTKTVILDAGESTTVIFSVTEAKAAIYRVRIDSQHSEFSVTKEFHWWWVVIPVVVVIIIAVAVTRRRQRHYG